MPDPKLKTAMTEIEGVLAKHDICASVVLTSQTHAENRLFLNASWSAIVINPKNGEMRFRAKKTDFVT